MSNISPLLKRLYARSGIIHEAEEKSETPTPIVTPFSALSLVPQSEETPQKSEETSVKKAEEPKEPEAKKEEKEKKEEPEVKPVPAEPKTAKEIAAMKTLVLHIKDPTTDFLIPIYSDKKDWTVIRDNVAEDKLRKIMAQYERIVMLGHGTSSGLIGHGHYGINVKYVDILEKMKYNVHIWCNADGFMKQNGLTGFYTGMFISEVREAEFMKIKATEKEVNYSNALFAQTMRKYINSDTKTMLEKVKGMYTSKKNPVIIDNFKRLYYTDVVLPKPPAPVYTPYTYTGHAGKEWMGSYQDWYNRDDDDNEYSSGWYATGGKKQPRHQETQLGEWKLDPSTGAWSRQQTGIKLPDDIYDWDHLFLPFRTWMIYEEGHAFPKNGRLITFDPTINRVTIKAPWKSVLEPPHEIILDYDTLSVPDKKYIEHLVKEIEHPKDDKPKIQLKVKPAPQVGKETSYGYSWQDIYLPYRMWKWWTPEGINNIYPSSRIFSYDIKTHQIFVKSQHDTELKEIPYNQMAVADKQYVEGLVDDIIAHELEKEKAPKIPANMQDNPSKPKLRLVYSPKTKRFGYIASMEDIQLPLIHDNMTEEEVNAIAAQYLRRRRIQDAKELEAAGRANETPQEKREREKEEREIEKDRQAENALKSLSKDASPAQREAAIQYYSKRLDRRKRRTFLNGLRKNFKEKGIIGFGQPQSATPKLLPASPTPTTSETPETPNSGKAPF